MKRLWILGILVGLGLLSCKKTNPIGEETLPYVRTLLVELFTNVYCPNCEVAEAWIDSVASANDRVVVIEYHDPAYNPLDPFSGPPADSQIAERSQFYFGSSAHGYPYVLFDGILENEGIGNIGGWGNQVETRLAQNTSVSLSISGVYDTLSRTGSLSVQVDGDTGQTRQLYVALTESDLIASGQTYHHVFRRFYPGPEGISLTIPTETTVSFEIDPTWNPASLTFVVFVQNPSTREVLQATEIPLLALPPDTSHLPTLPFLLHVTDTLLIYQNTDPLVDTLYIVNTGTTSDRYGLWIEPIFPTDSTGQPLWFLSICMMDSMCLPFPHDTTGWVPPADSVGYTVDVFTLGNPGTGEFWIYAHSMNNPAVRESVRVQIQVTE